MMQAYVVVYYRHMDYRPCVCVRVRGCDVCVAPQFGWLLSNVSGFNRKHAAMKCLHPNPSQKTSPAKQNEKNKHIVMLVPMVDLMHTEMPWNALTLAAHCQLKSCYKVDTMLVLTYGLQALCLSEFHAAAPKNLAWEHPSYTIHQKSNPSNYQTKVDFLLLSKSDVCLSIRSAPHPKVFDVWHNARLCLASRPLKPGHFDTGNYTIFDRSMRRAHQTSRQAALKCCWGKITLATSQLQGLLCLYAWTNDMPWFSCCGTVPVI